MTVRFLDRARSELDGHIADVKAHDIGAARRLLHDVAEALVLLERQPGLGSEHSLVRTGRRARRWFVAPLMFYYEERAGGIVVVRVRHHAQRPVTR